MRMDMTAPILMTEEYWKNSQLSIARFYGSIRLNGHLYVIVNKDGVTPMELSIPGSPHYVGDGKMAIEPGEPCDMIMSEWLPVYRALGRDRTMEIIRQDMSLEDAMKLVEK